MKLFFNRLRLSAKRSFLNPYIYGMAAILLALAITCVVVPPNESSAYIPVAILNLDDHEDTEAAVEEILEMGSVFEFYEVDSEEEMYEDLASGKCNTGYILPEGLMENCGSLRTIPKIRVITTPSSTLPLVSSEEVYMKLYRYFALTVLTETIDRTDATFPDDYKIAARRIYDSYIGGNVIYHLEEYDDQDYNEITNIEKVVIPVYKFAGFFLWMAALIGALSYLNDCDNKLYVRMGKGGRLVMGLILPMVHVIPVMLISVICFLIAGIRFSLGHVLVYSLGVIIVAFVLSSIVAALPVIGRKSSLFAAVLPTYLILSFLFGGVIISLSVYSPVLRTISMFFPPYFF